MPPRGEQLAICDGAFQATSLPMPWFKLPSTAESLQKMIKKSIVLACCLAAFAATGCGKKKSTTAKPAGTAVSSAAKKSAAASAKTGSTEKLQADNACVADDVGKCGCLGDLAFEDTNGVIYDVVCCEAVGNEFTVYSCGDLTCNDSGAEVVCQ